MRTAVLVILLASSGCAAPVSADDGWMNLGRGVIARQFYDRNAGECMVVTTDASRYGSVALSCREP